MNLSLQPIEMEEALGLAYTLSETLRLINLKGRLNAKVESIILRVLLLESLFKRRVDYD